MSLPAPRYGHLEFCATWFNLKKKKTNKLGVPLKVLASMLLLSPRSSSSSSSSLSPSSSTSSLSLSLAQAPPKKVLTYKQLNHPCAPYWHSKRPLLCGRETVVFFMLNDFLLEDLLNTSPSHCDLFTAGLLHIYLSSTFLVGLFGILVELLSGRIFQTWTI